MVLLFSFLVSVLALWGVFIRLGQVDAAVVHLQAQVALLRTSSPVSRGGVIFESKQMKVTAYTRGYESTGKRVGDRSYGVTASGYRIQGDELVLAAGQNIPFGTKIFVPGYGLGVVLDRGGAIEDGHIDVYINDVSAARRWGVKQLDCKILR